VPRHFLLEDQSGLNVAAGYDRAAHLAALASDPAPAAADVQQRELCVLQFLIDCWRPLCGTAERVGVVD
jgi:hypothetical protein